MDWRTRRLEGRVGALLAEWEGVRAVDHHCHPLLRWPLDLTPFGLRAVFTEAADPTMIRDHVPCTAAYRGALASLAGALGCAATEGAILEVRAREDPGTYANALLERSGTGVMLLDHGFGGADAFTIAEHRREVSLPQHEIVRLETLGEDLAADVDDPLEWFEAVRAALRAAVEEGACGVKTIAAYRSGLQLRRHSPEEVAREFSRWRAALRRESDLAGEPRPRLSGEALCHTLAFEAAACCRVLDVPLQVHCGLGDPDEDLALASPLGLRPLFEDPALRGLHVVLLHCYPYHREAAYLSAMYPRAFMDLSLAIPLAAADGARALREALGLCPWSKLLYATDASRLPELYLVAASRQREALAVALSDLVAAGFLGRDEGVEAGRRVLAGNATALYRLQPS
jgi:predicted TIM-barrel fold metal-dependent hydrolase